MTAVIIVIQCDWEKLTALTAISIAIEAELQVNCRMYGISITNAMLYGSVTWAIQMEYVNTLRMNNMRTISSRCDILIQTGQILTSEND